MKDKFPGADISRTQKANGGALELELTDADGHQTIVHVTPDIALRLAQVLNDFANSTSSPFDTTLTKKPKTFSVGTGRFDDLVLVRFEDDAPYALGPDEAMELGEALLEQSECVGLRPVKLLQ